MGNNVDAMCSYDIVNDFYLNSADFPFAVLIVDYYREDINTVKKFLKWYINNNTRINLHGLASTTETSRANELTKSILNKITTCNITFSSGNIWVSFSDTTQGDISIVFPTGLIDSSVGYYSNISNVIDKATTIDISKGNKHKLIKKNDVGNIVFTLEKIKNKIKDEYYLIGNNMNSVITTMATKIYINNLSTNKEKINAVAQLYNTRLNYSKDSWMSFGYQGGETSYISSQLTDYSYILNVAYGALVVLRTGSTHKVINYLSDVSLHHFGIINKKNPNGHIEIYREMEYYTNAPLDVDVCRYIILSNGVDTFIFDSRRYLIIFDLIVNHKFKIINYIDTAINGDMFTRLFGKASLIDYNIEKILFNSQCRALDLIMFDDKWKNI